MVQDVEVVVVVDRGDKYFSPESFYALRTPENEMKILWCDDLPPGYEVLGKVLLCTVPWVEGMKKKSSGFLEDDEDDLE